MLYEFTKHLFLNKNYPIKQKGKQTSYIRKIDKNTILFTSPRKKVTYVNLNSIGFLQKDTKGKFITNIDLPQTLLAWLWDNLDLDQWKEEK